jgi:DNA-directed RNA polymerase specialized sigma24 family protein
MKSLVAEVLELHLNGVSPEEISAAVGLSLTKVLNIIERDAFKW